MPQTTFRPREEVGCWCRDLLRDTISKTRMRCSRIMLRRPCRCLEGFGQFQCGRRRRCCHHLECPLPAIRTLLTDTPRRCWFRLRNHTQRRCRCCARGGRRAHATGHSTAGLALVLFRGNVDDRNVTSSQQSSTCLKTVSLLRTPRLPQSFWGSVSIHWSC